VVVLTLVICLPFAVAVWWNSPGGVQYRRMREAEDWLSRAVPVLGEDPRFAGIKYVVSTSESIWLHGEMASVADLPALGILIESLEPPCPVVVVEIRDSRGEMVSGGVLYRPSKP
jgi:hypothetical protein